MNRTLCSVKDSHLKLDSGEVEMSDENLFLRYRDQGDMQAFEQLLQRYEKPLLGYLRRYLQNGSLADEVWQLTMVRLHQKRHLFTKDRRIRPWLYSIATHLAVDALRTRKKQHAVSLDATQGDPEEDVRGIINVMRSHAPSPVEALEARERADWVHRALERLPDSFRALLSLIYFQGLTFEETAQALKLPVGTVKSRVHKALRQMNRAWDQNHQVAS